MTRACEEEDAEDVEPFDFLGGMMQRRTSLFGRLFRFCFVFLVCNNEESTDYLSQAV